MTPLTQEIVRQVLRWLGVYLMTAGWLPEPLADLVSDAGTSELVIGILSYALAEAWWLKAKVAK